jgi:hypothetical protein
MILRARRDTDEEPGSTDQDGEAAGTPTADADSPA